MKLPKNAKRVFKGEIFEIWQWRQKMFDGSVKIFERAKRQDSVIVIATTGNKIIVLKQKQPDTNWFYCTPSGRMDVVGENPRQAALRELLEETGMKPSNLKLWKRIEKAGQVIHTMYFFIARGCKKVSEQKLDAGERIVVKFATFNEYLKLVDKKNSHLYESAADLLRARQDPKYRAYLKKLFFG